MDLTMKAWMHDRSKSNEGNKWLKIKKETNGKNTMNMTCES